MSKEKKGLIVSEIRRLFKEQRRFNCKINVQHENLWCIPFEILKDESSEIKLKVIVNNVPIGNTVKFNQVLEVNSSEIREILE